ncbi:MAG TPA: DinB family protein [Thermoanaerobaculia bacterium]|nr:DinB family protein [Thermoanaerobaculia bacterium]
MTTITIEKTATPNGLDARVLSRVLEEGYGPGAWHGPDLKAALADVTPDLAFWRPAPGRHNIAHNIAEIALHHAYTLRSVRGQLSGTSPEPFALEGDDWFPAEPNGLSWPEIQSILETEQGRLADVVSGLAENRVKSPKPDADRFDLILGITCHAVYHAGQVQLLKRLNAG